MSETTSRPRWAIAAALIAVVFGVVTVFVGGKTLFGPPAERAAAGNIVPFVLWFNFIAGFAYIIAGCGVFCGNVGQRDCLRRLLSRRSLYLPHWVSTFFLAEHLR